MRVLIAGNVQEAFARAASQANLRTRLLALTGIAEGICRLKSAKPGK